MENKKNGLIIVLVIIIAILCLFVGWLLGEKFSNKESELLDNSTSNTEKKYDKITVDMLYGTYTWEKKYINDFGSELNLKIKLVLNSDGTATYNATSGYEEEATKGTFIYENGQIKYTKEYYNYNGTNGQNYDEVYTDNNSKIETFVVIDKDTLQNTYYNNITSLTK